jgi:hypothetical protein
MTTNDKFTYNPETLILPPLKLVSENGKELAGQGKVKNAELAKLKRKDLITRLINHVETL